MGTSGLARWLGWAVAGAVAGAVGVGVANVATHYARAWLGVTPAVDFWIGLAGFVVGFGVALGGARVALASWRSR